MVPDGHVSVSDKKQKHRNKTLTAGYGARNSLTSMMHQAGCSGKTRSLEEAHFSKDECKVKKKKIGGHLEKCQYHKYRRQEIK